MRSVEPPADSCPQVAMILPSWGRRCGLAEYTRALCQALQKLGCGVRILGGPLQTINQADLQGAQIIHFQYEYSLYENYPLEAFRQSIVNLGGHPLLTLHSFTDGLDAHNLLIRRLFNDIVVHGGHTRELLRNRGWPQELYVIPMGVPEVPLGEQTEIRGALCPGAGPAIGFCGFMHWHKGIMPLVQAVQQLHSSGYPHAKCCLFSGTTENDSTIKFYNHFLQQVDLLGLKEAVTLQMDFIEEDRLVRCLGAMDINVLPYTECGYNSSSSAARLLMAARKPIVTSETSFFADLNDQVVKIAVVTPESITGALTRLLKDPSVQHVLVERLDRYARENTWDICARKHLQLYWKLMSDIGTEVS